MANTRQAAKRARQSEKRRQENKWQMTRMRSSLKGVLAMIEGKDKEKAKAAYQLASSLVDRLATKGLIQKNKAARHKSRLSAHIKAMG